MNMLLKDPISDLIHTAWQNIPKARKVRKDLCFPKVTIFLSNIVILVAAVQIAHQLWKLLFFPFCLREMLSQIILINSSTTVFGHRNNHFADTVLENSMLMKQKKIG